MRKKLEPFVKDYDWGMRASESMASLFVSGDQLVAELWWLVESFLLKMLFVARPLSLQAHPNREQVAARPNLFPDPHPKPEVVIALTRFEALCGFLSPERVAYNITGTNLPPSFESLFRLNTEETRALIADTLVRVRVLPPRRDIEVFRLLSDLHPGDPAVLAPFYMEHVCLERGEALVVPGGQPHCYLSGQGVECMPPSDNIVRCGLTRKPVDTRLFFELCVPQPVAVRTHPYRHEALDPYFRMCCPKGPYLCKKGSVVLRLSGDHGAWLIEKDKALFFNEDEDALVVSPP